MVFRILGRKNRSLRRAGAGDGPPEGRWSEPRLSMPPESREQAESEISGEDPGQSQGASEFVPEDRAAEEPGTSAPAPAPQQAPVPLKASLPATAVESPRGEGPTFSAGVNDRVWRKRAKPVNYYGEVSKLIRTVLTPTRPKRAGESFVGRRRELATAIRAIEEERAHVLIAGEPGIGKSSLANAIAAQAEAAGYFVARLSSTSDLTRERFVTALFEELGRGLAAAPAGGALLQQFGITRLEELLPQGESHIMPVLRALLRLEKVQMLMILDDFDLVVDGDLRRFVHELMKGLSDHAATLSFVLVASETAAAGAEEPGHKTAWLRRIRLRPLAVGEAEAVLATAEREIGLLFEDEVRRTTRLVSQGHPRVLQWLAFLAVRRAVERFSSSVAFADLQAAIPDAIERIGGDLVEQYEAVRRGEEPGLIENALLLAALSPERDGLIDPEMLSRLAPWVLPKALTPLALHAALSRLCDQERGAILAKVSTPRGTLYRFADATMRSLVLLKNFDRLDFSHLADSLSEQTVGEIRWSGNGDAQPLLSRPS